MTELQRAIENGQQIKVSFVEDASKLAKRFPENQALQRAWVRLARLYHEQTLARHGRFIYDAGGVCAKATRLLADACGYPLITVELGPSDVVEIMPPLIPIHEDPRETIA